MDMRRMGTIALGCAIALGESGCSQMVRSEQLASSNFVKEGDVSSSHKPNAVLGIPYYMPRTMLKVSVEGAYPKKDDPKATPNPTEYKINLKVLEVVQVADPDRVYLLDINTSGLADDDIKIGVSSNGLLSNVKAVSEDKSGEILKKIAETTGEIISAIPKLLGPTIAVAPPEADACKVEQLRPFQIEWMIPVDTYVKESDAPNPNGSEEVLKDLQDAIYLAMNGLVGMPSDPGTPVSFKISVTSRPLEALKTEVAAASTGASAPVPGIRFRLPRPAEYRLTVDPTTYSCKNNLPTQILSGKNLVYMDPNHEFFFDMARSPLVKKSVELTVENGVLTAAHVEKPSTIYAAASLPMELIKFLLSPIMSLIHGDSSAGGTSAGGS